MMNLNNVVETIKKKKEKELLEERKRRPSNKVAIKSKFNGPLYNAVKCI